MVDFKHPKRIKTKIGFIGFVFSGPMDRGRSRAALVLLPLVQRPGGPKATPPPSLRRLFSGLWTRGVYLGKPPPEKYKAPAPDKG